VGMAVVMERAGLQLTRELDFVLCCCYCWLVG
jgi:hypothetical protein